MSTLANALLLAVKAHNGQTDKNGQPYALHPLRMMLRFADEEAQVVALLHDVVEDTEWTLERLRGEGFSETILAAVDSLSRRESESYDDFIERVRPDPLARRVKLADLEDNMNLQRVGELQEKDWERLQRYHRAWRSLRGDV
jgi:(p)ppGpp synthase/HD superfamily hydrolase